MAYRFPTEDLLTTNQRVREAIAAAPSDDFGALESMAVWLGMRDDAATLRRPGRFITWLRDFFGFLPPRPLSDARLESIRRLTVSLRLDLLSIAWEEAVARRTGVTQAQIRALKARFSGQAQAAT
jgi:hypothetical protein